MEERRGVRLADREGAGAAVNAGGNPDVASLPVEMHCHGIAEFDFSAFEDLDLHTVNARARAEGVVCVPTVFLTRDSLGEFCDLMRRFDALSKQGDLPNVAGFAVEGPLLSSSGGTPAAAGWRPSREEWARLCACGPLGLRYAVISPDFADAGSALAEQTSGDDFGLAWAVAELVGNGIAPALGHFSKADPGRSAARVRELLEIKAGLESPVRVLTDHLFNDMPRAFRHAWRGTAGHREREAELPRALAVPWKLSDLDEAVGIVPATLLRAAHSDELMLCLNFDGEHVDHVFCQRTLDLVGSACVIAMSDRSDTGDLAGERLHKNEASSLWYQDDDLVAAGSTPIIQQISHLHRLGCDEDTIHKLTAANPRRALGLGIAA